MYILLIIVSAWPASRHGNRVTGSCIVACTIATESWHTPRYP